MSLENIILPHDIQSLIIRNIPTIASASPHWNASSVTSSRAARSLFRLSGSHFSVNCTGQTGANCQKSSKPRSHLITTLGNERRAPVDDTFKTCGLACTSILSATRSTRSVGEEVLKV